MDEAYGKKFKELKIKVWERDKSQCQGEDCGFPLDIYEEETVISNSQDTYGKLILELGKDREIPVYSWLQLCHRCKKHTEVSTYYFELDYNIMLGDNPFLDEEMKKRYATVHLTYSNTMQSKVIANKCQHCSALQGNFFVRQTFLELTPAIKKGTFKPIDTIKHTVTIDDFSEPILESREPVRTTLKRKIRTGVVHHINADPYDNRLDNLLLLCTKCHRKAHAKLNEVK